MNREEIISSNPLDRTMMSYGLKLEKRTQTGFMVKCPFHEDKNPSLSVDVTKGVFFCHGCKATGSVIDFVSKKEGITPGEAMRKLGGSNEQFKPRPTSVLRSPEPVVSQNNTPTEPVNRKIVSIYSYKDELGKELYQSVRFEPKDFSQRHSKNGQWVWNLQGVRRVLYQLPLILKANSSYVWIVEGEKDCDNLKKCGFVATCCPMGAGKWMQGYNEPLAGKELILCGDNDEPGRKHIAQILESVCKIAKTVRHVVIPEPHKDCSDFIASFPDFESAARELFNLFEGATVLTQGVAVPVHTTAELERSYQRHIEDSKKSTFDIGQWLPSLRKSIRGLVPGEMATILAGTSVGKTACLQNIAVSAHPLPTLLFELELPDQLTFERFVSISNQVPSYEVHTTYNEGKTVDWRGTGKLDHIAHCFKSRLTTEDIERIILQTELKTGVRPVLVLLDYIGLVQSNGKSRYEKLSDVAESLRIIAKATKTIIVIACQISRKKSDDSPDVFLTDAKDSGSIENSSSLLIGAWRDEQNKFLIHLKILKNTRGPTGQEIVANFNGLTMTISEPSKIVQEDVPESE